MDVTHETNRKLIFRLPKQNSPFIPWQDIPIPDTYTFQAPIHSNPQSIPSPYPIQAPPLSCHNKTPRHSRYQTIPDPHPFPGPHPFQGPIPIPGPFHSMPQPIPYNYLFQTPPIPSPSIPDYTSHSRLPDIPGPTHAIWTLDIISLLAFCFVSFLLMTFSRRSTEGIICISTR